MTPETSDPTGLPPKKKRGCFFYGCLISLALLLLVGVALGVAGYYGVRAVKGMITEYSDPSESPMATVNMPAEELKALQERVAAFNAAAKSGAKTEPLVLTGPEFNALLANTPEMADYREMFAITIDGDQIKAQVSLPLEKFLNTTVFDVKGRYLNGTGVFDVSLHDGELSVIPETMEVKGKPLPKEWMTGLRQNMAQNYNQQHKDSILKYYQSIEVKDGKMIITPKSGAHTTSV
jgi:hypothetical protein